MRWEQQEIVVHEQIHDGEHTVVMTVEFMCHKHSKILHALGTIDLFGLILDN